MKRQDVLSIIITFVTGFIAGGYVYFTGFAPTVANIEIQTESTLNEFTIVSEVYGGCRSSCPSYQLLKDGSYRYLYSTSFDSDQILKTGTIPFNQRRELQRVFTVAELERQSREITPALCESFSDGIDVRYQVVLGDETYELDTCGTAIDTNSELWKNLSRVWDYLETSGVGS